VFAIRLLALPLISGALLLGGSSAASNKQAVVRAAIAPFRDVLDRNAGALCRDFVPAVASTLGQQVQSGGDCESAVQATWALTAPNEVLPKDVTITQPHVERLEIGGTHALIRFTFVAQYSTSESTAVLDASPKITFQMERVGTRWLVASEAALVAAAGCRPKPPEHCSAGAKVLLFVPSNLEPLGAPTANPVPVPVDVKRAGRSVEREFKSGERVAVQSGCLACHRIGGSGNKGPGQNLTRVGLNLSVPQIEYAILHPRGPMPSFKHLPPRKLHDLVRFLSLLR
jgi:mono/diheme cytochrome c family protein